jgi:hypothetical protein
LILVVGQGDTDAYQKWPKWRALNGFGESELKGTTVDDADEQAHLQRWLCGQTGSVVRPPSDAPGGSGSTGGKELAARDLAAGHGDARTIADLLVDQMSTTHRVVGFDTILDTALFDPELAVPCVAQRERTDGPDGWLQANWVSSCRAISGTGVQGRHSRVPRGLWARSRQDIAVLN